MSHFEDIKEGCVLRGVVPGRTIQILAVQHHGKDVAEITYRDESGRPGSRLCYRGEESQFELVDKGRAWAFDGDGALLRLVSEAHRIQLAHLFDPHLAVHTSLVEPLPHQITAVYGAMLPRQPLRFLLADDPGAGKTIMAGLLIKELLIRSDLKRCLVVCPGNLVEQWQDELSSRFQLPFDILTNDRLETARTGNAFSEIPLLIARLDKLSRDEDAQAKIAQTEWDLIICDESHKMSASFFGGEIKETKRYKLGKLLGGITRHLLLMTATPHNGKEEDFQLFMALLDSDRFEGKFRDGAHTADVTDLMRRMVKEQLVKFDGTPLFPERRAYTVNYKLSDGEAALYQAVTDYVRHEFNRVEALQNEGRKGTVGFALTVLQRRLASSPEAIYQSLKRRRERLEKRLRDEELLKRGALISDALATARSDDISEIDDIEDAPESEVEQLEEEIVDSATAAQTIAELQTEIAGLKDLEASALKVRNGGTDRKWEELSHLLQDESEMFDAARSRRKLIIFTEHRDTLNYLTHRIRSLIGRPEAVINIHGGIGREERKKAEELFKQDKDVLVLVATDAAGEGINLQRGHLMVNYDLPWNPNRIEQRFGRIHRIGQTEVCHLWNLVAPETREGDVYSTLLRKLEVERAALGGGVFDVLGRAIDGTELRQLLIEAIRYGNDPATRARLTQVIEAKLDRDHLRNLLDERALSHETLDATKVRRIREDMERIEARRLQPHFIAAFFKEAFGQLGGTLRERETDRFEITHVPALIRSRDRQIGIGAPVLPRYERVCFEKELINVQGKPLAEFVCPGHPLLESVTDLMLERHRDLLKRGAVLVDEDDPCEEARVLLYLEHAVQDARPDSSGAPRVISRKLQFVEMDANGAVRSGGPAPYLDYRPLKGDESALIAPVLTQPWLAEGIESRAVSYAIANLATEHLQEVKSDRLERIDKTERAVKDRLTKEINYWDYRANQLKEQEAAGKVNAKLNSAKARARADELEARMQRRLQELAQERQISALPPVVAGGALIVPVGLLARLQGVRDTTPNAFARETRRVEELAMRAVIAAEQQLGFEPADISSQNLGYDVESRVPGAVKLRFLEVKGRIAGATTVTITKNEILTAFNKPDDFILALVQVPASAEFGERDAFVAPEPTATYGKIDGCVVRYVRKPFQREPDFGATSVNYSLSDLLERSVIPQ
jgi:superfamily II DNA or RNA helicase